MSPDAGRGLLQFQTAQKTFDIGGTKVGGLPGVRPVVLIGSLFYHGQKIVIDGSRGEFDRDGAEKLIRAQEDFAERTGNPGMLDVVGASEEAICRHLEFTAETTDMPLLLDGTTTEVRIAGLEYVAKNGLADRIVYNSIQPETTDEEFQAIREAGVRSAILLTYYLMDFSAAGRLTAVHELMPRVEAAGVENVMVDTCVLDIATLGQSLGAIYDVKDQLGLPAGGGVHNAVVTWGGLKTKMGKRAYEPCVASAVAASIACGADFVLYGPIEDLDRMFPVAAMLDTSLSQLAIERGEQPPDDHPRRRVG